ncbi:MAG: glycosyltransferase family 39 protein [Acidobacteriaceae bacterium]
MLILLRNATRHVVAALVAGLLLRLWFIHYYPVIDGDTLVYGGIAQNWFWHGIYGFTRPDGLRPTLIRLPGYPLFLGICFFFFGVDSYGKILVLQAVIDLCSCLLVAGFAARTISRRAGIATLYLAALCPFTANYVASPLTETPSIFCVALGLYALARYVERPSWESPLRSIWFWALAFSISYATLLRPDGALLGVVLVSAMFWYGRKIIPAARSLKLALICTLVALVPFAAWTIRNARTFHVFQPLAPRYANDPGEFVPRGWIRWVQSWAADYASTAEIFWSVNGSPLDISLLPTRAVDTAAEKSETTKLFNEYNKADVMTPALSAQFGRLAQQRIAQHPFRFYVTLPLMRLANMWLRPRVDQLWIELRWWQYGHHPAETIFSWSYAALNLAYLLLAIWGLRKRVPFASVMVAYVVLRCLLLLTLEAPEARYTLECFPIIFILAGAALANENKVAEATSAPPASLSPS